MIEIEGPDGVIYEFPAGTDQATMARAMAQVYGAPKPAQTQQPQQPYSQAPQFQNAAARALGMGAPAPAMPNLLRGDRPQVQGAPLNGYHPPVPEVGMGQSAAVMMGQGLTFGFSDEMNAGLRSFLPGQTYEGALDNNRALIDAARTQNPKTAIASEIGGALAPALFTGGATLPANAGLATKAAIGSAVGAGQGAAYGFGTGEGGFENRATNAWQGAIIGAAAGAAAPAVITGVRKIGQLAINPIRSALNIGSENQASSYIRTLIERSGKNADDVAAALRTAANEGQPMYSIADELGSAGQRGLSTMARQPGEASQAVADTMLRRQDGQANRLGRFITESLDAPDTAAMQGAVVKAERRMTGNANYGAARANAAPVDIRGALATIDDRLGPMAGSGVAGDGIDAQFARFRSRLATPAGTDPNMQLSDFQRVLGVKQDIDDAIGAAVRAGRNNEARELGILKTQVDDALAASSPDYAGARDAYAASSRAIDAIDTGKKAASGTVRVEDNARTYSGLSPDERGGFRAGYVDPLMARIDNSAVGVNKARPLTSEKAAADFGMMASNPALLARQIGREQTMFETAGRALGGSKTADNLADIADGNAELSSVITNLFTGNWGTATRQAIQKVANAATGNSPKTRAMIADMLMSSDVQKAITPAVQKQIAKAKTDSAVAALLRSALIVGAQ